MNHASRSIPALVLLMALTACPDAKTSNPGEEAAEGAPRRPDDPPDPASAPSDAPPADEEHTMTDGPFELQFNPRTKATLRNRSGQEQFVLHDSGVQPSELVLTGPDGSVPTPFDTRSIKKFDNTVYEHLFQRVPPGGTVELFAVETKRADGGVDVIWGPYRFEGLPKGTYRAVVRFRSEIATYFDEASGQTEPKAGVWTGTVESAPVELSLR